MTCKTRNCTILWSSEASGRLNSNPRALRTSPPHPTAPRPGAGFIFCTRAPKRTYFTGECAYVSDRSSPYIYIFARRGSPRQRRRPGDFGTFLSNNRGFSRWANLARVCTHRCAVVTENNFNIKTTVRFFRASYCAADVRRSVVSATRMRWTRRHTGLFHCSLRPCQFFFLIKIVFFYKLLSCLFCRFCVAYEWFQVYSFRTIIGVRKGSGISYESLGPPGEKPANGYNHDWFDYLQWLLHV